MKLKLGKTEIVISYLLICLLAFSIVLGIFEGFAWCALAIALHEGGHLAMMILFGYFPKRIKISPFEILIDDSARQQRHAAQNALIIFFGPFVNFICFPVCYLLYLEGGINTMPFAAANLSVGLFNSLPVMSLDGGQLLYLFLTRFLSSEQAERTVDFLTFVFIFPLAALGFFVLLKSKNNFSLLFVSVYLIVSLVFKGNRYY